MNWPNSIKRDIQLTKSNTALVFRYTITVDDTLTHEEQLAAVQSLTADSFSFTVRLFLDNPDLNPQIDKPSWQVYEEYSVALGFIYFVRRTYALLPQY